MPIGTGCGPCRCRRWRRTRASSSGPAPAAHSTSCRSVPRPAASRSCSALALVDGAAAGELPEERVRVVEVLDVEQAEILAHLGDGDAEHLDRLAGGSEALVVTLELA